MRQQVLERRVELLKMEGSGFSTTEIVKHLSDKYGVTERQLYYDYERRKTWQTMIQQLADPQAFLLKIINRYEQIYQKASFIQLQADNDNARIGALRTMLEANHALHLTLIPTGTESQRQLTPEATDAETLFKRRLDTAIHKKVEENLTKEEYQAILKYSTLYSEFQRYFEEHPELVPPEERIH